MKSSSDIIDGDFKGNIYLVITFKNNGNKNNFVISTVALDGIQYFENRFTSR